MLLLNFGHPLTDEQIEAAAKAIGQGFSAILNVRFQLDFEQPLQPQIEMVVNSLRWTALFEHRQSCRKDWNRLIKQVEQRYLVDRGGMNHKLRIQVWILLGVILSNFVAQVFYFLHLYSTPQHPYPDLKSSLVMGAVLSLFLIGWLLLLQKPQTGYYVMLAFLVMDFGFYLWNLLGGVLHGYGWFFHLAEPDPILWAVFAVGYLNFFAAGYFLILLVQRRHAWVAQRI